MQTNTVCLLSRTYCSLAGSLKQAAGNASCDTQSSRHAVVANVTSVDVSNEHADMTNEIDSEMMTALPTSIEYQDCCNICALQPTSTWIANSLQHTGSSPKRRPQDSSPLLLRTAPHGLWRALQLLPCQVGRQRRSPGCIALLIICGSFSEACDSHISKALPAYRQQTNQTYSLKK